MTLEIRKTSSMSKVLSYMLPVISMIRSSKETEAVVIMPKRIPLLERKWAFTSTISACLGLTILTIEVLGRWAGGTEFPLFLQGITCLFAVIFIGVYWLTLTTYHRGRALYADRIEHVGNDQTPVSLPLNATDVVRFVESDEKRTVVIFDRAGQRTALIEDPVCYDMQGRPTGTDLVDELRQRIRAL